MSAKRILYTIPNVNTAGSGLALKKLAQGVKNQGWDVHIAMLHTRGELAQELMSEFKVHEFQFLSSLRPLGSLFINSLKVSNKLKEISPSVIHSFNYMAEYSEALAAVLAGIPWIFSKKNMSWYGGAYNQWKLKSFLAKKIIVQNTDMLKLFYPKSSKTELIPRGVDFDHFAKSRDLRFDIPNGLSNKEHRVLITVANLLPVKGVEDLIRAFGQIYHNMGGWQLWIVGSTSLDENYLSLLKNVVHELALENVVYFLGKKHDIRPYLGSAEIFVLPTKDQDRREGSPVAVLEAMAAGLVVLGSKVPGIKDQLATMQDFLYEAGNVDALIQKLEPLMRNTTEMNRLQGEYFAELCRKHFSISDEVSKHLKLYNAIVK